MNIGHIDKGPEQNVVGFRNTSGELEKAHGEWNTLELVFEDKVVRKYVNGKLANVGTDPFPAEGKVLFQSEGAEVYFRNIQIFSLTDEPEGVEYQTDPAIGPSGVAPR